MTVYKDFELKLNGSVIIRGRSFQEVDENFIKAMKAIAKRWDIDVRCSEQDPENTKEKDFDLKISGSVIIDGDTFEGAEVLFWAALDSIAAKGDVNIKQGEINTRYDPPRDIRRGDLL